MTEKQATAKMAVYCSKAEHCEYDVRKKLLAMVSDEKTVTGIIEYLKKENYLNELRFCRSFVNDKLKFNKWGRKKIFYELKKKHISETTIQKVFEEFSDEEFKDPLIKVLESKIKTIGTVDPREKRIKLFRFAVGKGYDTELVNKCLNQILEESYSDEFDL